MQKIELNSWDEFKQRLTKYAALERAMRDAILFRGHSHQNWSLESTLDREYGHLNPHDREEKLRRLLAQFRSELLGLDPISVPLHLNDQLELLARHHRVPTTLLDWTRSPYVAAYFAFERAAMTNSERVAIWAFNRQSLIHIDQDVEILEDIQLLVDNRRAIEQRAVSIRVPIGTRLEHLLEPGLTCFTIPGQERTTALIDLDEMLITSRSLFRDRDGAATTAIIRESME